MRTTTLPPELWAVILEFVVGNGIDKHEACTYLNFPYTSTRLRFSQNPLPERWLRNLRLVCRAFQALLDPILCFYFIMKDSKCIIPSSTRAICIDDRDNEACLRRLLSEPLKSHQIVMLDIDVYDTRNFSKTGLFDMLCNQASMLPNLRNLLLGFRNYYSRIPSCAPPQLWARINDSFPLLNYLSTRGNVDMLRKEPMVTFKSLIMVDFDEIGYRTEVGLPALRHAVVGRTFLRNFVIFNQSHQLESLILRHIDRTVQEGFDWGLFRSLRLLGIPQGYVFTIPPPPSDHSLRHLHIYVNNGPPYRPAYFSASSAVNHQLASLTMTIERFPTVSRITLDFQGETEEKRIMSKFDEQLLHPLGFYVNHEACGSGRYRTFVIDRIPVDPVPQSDTLTSWASLSRLASLLHL